MEVPVLTLKLKQSFRIDITMLNVLKKIVTMTMLAKQRDTFLIDHSGRDKNPGILKHEIEKEHLQYRNFKVISNSFHNSFNPFHAAGLSISPKNNRKPEVKKRKLSEALRINTLRPSLTK